MQFISVIPSEMQSQRRYYMIFRCIAVAASGGVHHPNYPEDYVVPHRTWLVSFSGFNRAVQRGFGNFEGLAYFHG
jgi:hypothetical protein